MLSFIWLYNFFLQKNIIFCYTINYVNFFGGDPYCNCNFYVCFFDFEKFSMSASSVKADTEVRIWPSPNPIYIYVKVKIPRYRLFVCLLFGPKQTYNYFIYFTILTIFSISRLFCERKTKCGPKYADVSKRKQNTPKTYCLPILRILVTFQL